MPNFCWDPKFESDDKFQPFGFLNFPPKNVDLVPCGDSHFSRSRYWNFAVSCFERLAESGAPGVFFRFWRMIFHGGWRLVSSCRGM